MDKSQKHSRWYHQKCLYLHILTKNFPLFLANIFFLKYCVLYSIHIRVREQLSVLYSVQDWAEEKLFCKYFILSHTCAKSNILNPKLHSMYYCWFIKLRYLKTSHVISVLHRLTISLALSILELFFKQFYLLK